MRKNLMSLLPFAIGFLILVTAGTEAALIWFMVYYLLMAVHLFLLKRQRKTLPPILRKPVIRIIDPERSD